MRGLNNYVIRAPIHSDLDALVLLCEEHAAYEGMVYEKSGKAQGLKVHLFNGSPSFHCLVVELDQELVGYATFAKQFSTWHACYYLYLDCLYLRSNVRGRGVGETVMKCIREYASTHNLSHVEWQTPIDNKAAIYFYQRLGAISQSKIRFSWLVI